MGDFDSALLLDDPPADAPDLETAEGVRAPEQLDGQVGDPRSDLYALGALLYELATGVAPFPGYETDANRPAIPAPSSCREELPPEFDQLVTALLDAAPDNRPQTAREVFDALTSIFEQPDEAAVRALIAQGEGQHIEFKSALRFSHDKPVEIPKLERKIAATVAAFLNSGGGTLLLGVADDGSTLGIEHDYPTFEKKPDRDRWGLRLGEVLRKYLTPDPTGCYSVSYVLLDHSTVAVVQCPPRDRETLLKGGTTEEFWIRADNSIQPLGLGEAMAHARRRRPVGGS